ncbi:hypothetical protein B0H10DRAFT_1836510 [Mycena sp. CBHHK59/15]|nr:hypothetical protein B0H10DRAFT_1836510 [Mycena sp. CBHHK59/15]
MVKCLNKYGVSFGVVYPSIMIQRELPLWHHPGENRQSQQNNGKKAKCLRNNHAKMTIGDGLDLARRLDDPQHDAHASCECDACEEDRTIRRCENPHACAQQPLVWDKSSPNGSPNPMGWRSQNPMQ